MQPCMKRPFCCIVPTHIRAGCYSPIFALLLVLGRHPVEGKIRGFVLPSRWATPLCMERSRRKSLQRRLDLPQAACQASTSPLLWRTCGRSLRLHQRPLPVRRLAALHLSSPRLRRKPSQSQPRCLPLQPPSRSS
jgi:hypothetical protein